MLKSVWLWAIGSLVGALVLIRSILFRTVRINRQAAMALYEAIGEDGRAFVLSEEVNLNNALLPTVYDAVCWLGGLIPFRFHVEERMLRAGFAGTDSVVTVTALRWRLQRVLDCIEIRKKDDSVNVYLLQPWDAHQIGSLKTDDNQAPYINPRLYRELEHSVAEVVEEKRRRTSAILYGAPGNGKSFLSRYLALKYKLPIYIVTLRPDQDNHDVIKMFSYLKGPCLIVMEDFDSYFVGRKCQLAEAKFTFDAILNVLDGTYATMDGTVVIMTVNDIDAVDPALKQRPGRFRYVLEVPNPDDTVLERIFDGCDVIPAAARKDYSLDELLAMRDSAEGG